MCCLVLQDNDHALEAFTKAAGIMPENPKYRANMAVALGLMGRREESLSLFNQVLPVDQANQNVAVLLGAEEFPDIDDAAPIESSNSNGTGPVSK